MLHPFSRKLLAVAGFLACGFAPHPASAQIQLNVCGIPPLPPCGEQSPPRLEERFIERRALRQMGSVCRTRYLVCELDDPQPVRSQCTCEDDDGEDVVGRVR
jgi:hypothetical protein